MKVPIIKSTNSLDSQYSPRLKCSLTTKFKESVSFEANA